MKLNGIKPYKRKARWRKRRDERRPEATYPNLIKGKFPIVPNLFWVSDFTYLKYHDQYLYLATLMDLYTREIVGWYLTDRHTSDLVIEAFLDAFQNTGLLPELVHSDQGSEYTSKKYTDLVEKLGVKVSMSKKSSPWENGYQESFFNNFKTDLGLEFDRFNTLGEFVEGIYQTINYYNNARIHTTLKMSPNKFRLLHT